MQTFLPYSDFHQSAACLDKRRLWKQCVECRQILFSKGWRHHPAVKMWQGYEQALRLYANVILEEYLRRGIRTQYQPLEVGNVVLPPWLGGPIHETHRSSLLRKDLMYYRQFGWTEDPFLEYHWPVP